MAATIATWAASIASETSCTWRGAGRTGTSTVQSDSTSSIEAINAAMIVDITRSFAVSACRRRRS
jgi:hypothetical protein